MSGLPQTVFDAAGNAYSVRVVDGNVVLDQQPPEVAEAHEIIRLILQIGDKRKRAALFKADTKATGLEVRTTPWRADCNQHQITDKPGIL